MKKVCIYAVLVASFALPTVASAYWNSNPAINIVSVKLNGGTYGSGTYLQVNPGDPITVTVTADLTYKAKWKGTNWGINNTGATPTCVNTKNKHARLFYTGHGSSWYGGDDRDDNPLFNLFFKRDHDDHDFDSDRETNNTYSVTFTIYAPKTTGLYDANFLPDTKNNCGSPLGSKFILSKAILVGKDTQAPVIAPHSDVLVTLTDWHSTGTTVTYTAPTATDDIDTNIAVSCSPASGTFFPVGSTIVSCFAHDTANNMAMPVSFSVTVALPPDVTPPTIAAHAPVYAEATSPSGIVVNYTDPTATDDRGGAVTVSCVPPSGSLFAIGTTTVTCTAADSAGNTASATFPVGVSNTPDVTPPTIPQHSTVTATLPHADSTTVIVNYGTVIASDDRDSFVPVVCTPAAGNSFSLGTTTVTCTAHDAANNEAVPMSFNVEVYPFNPQPVTIAAQTDESFMCLADTNGNAIDGWRACYTGGNSSSIFTTNLGKGSTLDVGSIQGVTLSLDPTFASGNPSIQTSPFRVSIICYSDASYTTPCTDWVAGNVHNGNANYFIFEDALITSDNKHWTADLTTADEQNFDNSSPVRFKSNYYYQLKIEDLGIGWPMFGQDPAAHTPAQPYWIISGVTY